MIYQDKLDQAKLDKYLNERLPLQLKRLNPRKVDDMFHELHDEAFEEIDCLKCANCCKTTSPVLSDKDVRRLAKLFKVKETKFIDQYIRTDSDGDYIFNSTPCPFLLEDNECSVYESRPNACREYPHTDRRKMTQILDLAVTNTLICPAVGDIMKNIRKGMKHKSV